MTAYTRAEVEAEAWFGGQKERVLETVAAIAAAREEQREVDAQRTEKALQGTLGKDMARFVRATPLDATPLADRIKELEAWQLAVADGLGFVNRAEGQDGYEVARPSVIVSHVREMERWRDEALARVAELEAELAATKSREARLRPYARHLGSCSVFIGALPCSCGFVAALAEKPEKAHRHDKLGAPCPACVSEKKP